MSREMSPADEVSLSLSAEVTVGGGGREGSRETKLTK